MLEGTGLTVGYPAAVGEPEYPIGPLELRLSPGEWVGLVGGNGSGKTALLLTLAGLLPPRSGQVQVEDLDLFAANTRAHASALVGVVFQEPESQFVCHSVARELAFPLENLGWPRDRIAARVRALIETFELSALTDAPPSHLSGGEMLRVALAAAMAPEPRYVLLDEPASHLDPVTRQSLVAWTRRLAAEGSTGVLWTACAEDECAGADRIQRLMEGEGFAEGFAEGSGEASAENSAATGTPGPGNRLAPDPGSGSSPALLWCARGIALTRRDARGEVRLWGGLDFEIRAGDWVFVTGANGAGKTALLEALIGWSPPTEGVLRGPGAGPSRGPRIGFLPQFPEQQLFAPTVLADVEFGLRHGGPPDRPDVRAAKPRECLPERAHAALASVGLDPARVRDRSPEALSLGERRRVALAGVLATEPDALLLDEPWAGLDPRAVSDLSSNLGRLHGRGVAVVVASHDPPCVAPPGARILPLPDPQRSDSGHL